MAEPIDLLFRWWTRMDWRKHTLDRIRQVAPTCSHGRAHWRHLANTIEPSVCGSDAALCQITLTACYSSDRHRASCSQCYSHGLNCLQHSPVRSTAKHSSHSLAWNWRKINLAAESGRARNNGWILMKQETTGWQRHQLNNMQITHNSLQGEWVSRV